MRVDVERRAKAKAVRDTLVLEAKKKTPLKMKIDDAPLSKTMLSKVRVEAFETRQRRARSRGLDARREEEG